MTNLTQTPSLDEVYKTYCALKHERWNVDKQGRGLAFEATVCDLFAAHKLLDRSPFHTENGRAEQIDGAISIYLVNALLEVKWVESGLAASELFSFIGKVDGKFVGTIGIFVSYEPLSENFLNALRLGRRQSVIVIHGEDIDLIFSPSFPLKEYLIAHIRYLSQENTPHYPAKRFLQSRTPIEIHTENQQNAKVAKYLKSCLDYEPAKNLVHEYAEDLTEVERIDALVQILGHHTEVFAQLDAKNHSWKAENLLKFAVELVSHLPQAVTMADTKYFVETLSPNFENESFERLTRAFAARYSYLGEQVKKKIEERLELQWNQAFGDYYAENRIAIPTSLLWDYLTKDGIMKLMPFVVRIVLSDRNPKFPQHQFALRVLVGSKSNPIVSELVLSTLRMEIAQSANLWIDPTDKTQTLEQVAKAVSRTNQRISDFVDGYDDLVADEVTRTWTNRIREKPDA